MENPQQYYRGLGQITAPGAQGEQFATLPKDVAGLCEVIQGVLIHRDMAHLYGAQFSPERVDETHIRVLSEMLERVAAMDRHPLAASRAPERRLVSTCRDFSLTLCAMLRSQGVPARPRCGFGSYFGPGYFVDHWVCEYWNGAQSRWILVDAQLDALQQKLFKPDFNTLDVPRDRFIIAGDAWQMCRGGRAEPSRFGLPHVSGLSGLWFIAGNVLRDLASLNRMELLPWDVWGLMPKADSELTDERKALLDRIAALTLAGDEAFPEIRKIYESDERLRVPPVVINALRNRPEAITGGPTTGGRS